MPTADWTCYYSGHYVCLIFDMNHIIYAFFIVDILLYVSEGLMPLLHVFFGELYRKEHIQHEAQIEDVTNTLYKAMLVCQVLVMTPR